MLLISLYHLDAVSSEFLTCVLAKSEINNKLFDRELTCTIEANLAEAELTEKPEYQL